jgi:hypothetical protein
MKRIASNSRMRPVVVSVIVTRISQDTYSLP